VSGSRLSTRLIDGPNPRWVLDQAELRVVAGSDRGGGLPLGAESIVIGSSSSCGLVLHDRTVSARHAEVQVTRRGYFIRDLESTNGIVIGSVRVDRAPLCDGMRIALGESTLSVRALGRKCSLPLAQTGELFGLVARSLKMRATTALLLQLAQSDTTVLIEGETGSGKELCAEALHRASARRDGPLITFDCGAVAESLAAATLFGHERGAFTGASEARPGLLEEARGGTLLLDEVGELPREVQPLLLGALERRRARRIGGKKEIEYDVRIIATTRLNLAEEVRAKRFREDLFYRLAVGRLRVPPLRERAEDLPILLDRFASQAGATIASEAVAPLLAYDWPGNVRELRNWAIRLAAHGDAAPPSAADPRARSPILFDRSGRLRPWLDARAQATAEIERAYVAEVLAQSQGNLSRAAEIAGITRQSLTTLASKHGLHPRSDYK
jgi:DNA-binding NtrC family response regulator